MLPNAGQRLNPHSESVTTGFNSM